MVLYEGTNALHKVDDLEQFGDNDLMDMFMDLNVLVQPEQPPASQAFCGTARTGCSVWRAQASLGRLFFWWYFIGSGLGGEPLKEGYSALGNRH